MKRDHYCTDTGSRSCSLNCRSSNSGKCPTRWYARYGKIKSSSTKTWRCFAQEALTSDMSRYDTDVMSSCWWAGGQTPETLSNMQKGKVLFVEFSMFCKIIDNNNNII